MTFSDRMVALVVRQLEKRGSDGTLTSTGVTPAAFDKRTGRPLPEAPLQRPVRAVVKSEIVEGVDGRLVRRTLAVMRVEPREGDTLEVDGKAYTVGSFIDKSIQGENIVYLAEVS